MITCDNVSPIHALSPINRNFIQMKRHKLLLFLLFCSICSSVFAQTTHSIKGLVIDTASNLPLGRSVVGVLQEKDSILVKFTRTQSDGSFSINGLPKGKFLLMVTYPGYADYIDNFSLDSAHLQQDFGKVSIVLKARLLADIVIKGQVTAIKIKGDTTEFNAAAYNIQPNSKVEDLLKQFPGIQVDKDGKITAQGVTVTKVLVDGEEFFGDDPTLVTKNLRGDMVDKVQLYDKKSDQAAFTGIDDGQLTKTLNIKLKEDKKNGYFGKADVGASPKTYYQDQLMFNKFTGKKKFSAYGTLGNNGKTGLNWEDGNKYGASGGNVELVDGGIMISGSGSDELDSYEGQYYGQGIPLARTGGLHFDNKWKDDKYTLNANYKVGSLEVDGTQNTISQNNLGTTAINSNSNQFSDNFIFRHKLDLMYQIRIDTTSTLKVSVDGTLKNSETRTENTSASSRQNNTMLNSSRRNLDNDVNTQLFNASLLWTKKLKKTGRTISLAANESVNNSDAEGNLYSKNNFFTELGDPDHDEVIDQRKTSDEKSNTLSSNLTYTEPFSKALSLVLNYGTSYIKSTADRKSFNASAPGVYTSLDAKYSNNFELNQLSNQAGAIFSFRKGKQIATFGTKAVAVQFDQTDLLTQKEYNRNFLNWTPQASYQYKFNTRKSVRFNYNGYTSQPRIDQIQPVLNNNDPLNIALGNSSLKPSFGSRFNLYYSTYKTLSDQYFSISASYNFTSKAIVSNRLTNTATGATTTQWVNLDGKSQSGLSSYFNYSRKVTFLADLNLGVSANVSRSIYYNYVSKGSETALNQTQSLNYSGGINISKYMEKKYDIYISYNPGFMRNKSTQALTDNNGRNSYAYGYLNLYLPGKVQVSGDLDYQMQGKTSSFGQNLSRTLITTSLSKKFMKAENLKVSVSGNDMLNQNNGFSRTSDSSFMTQRSYNTIKRYYLFSLAWDFSKMGGAAPTKSN